MRVLTYAEANLFLRAGDDMRWAEWPADAFVRWSETGEPQQIEGFVGVPYKPTQTEIEGDKWRRA